MTYEIDVVVSRHHYLTVDAEDIEAAVEIAVNAVDSGVDGTGVVGHTWGVEGFDELQEMIVYEPKEKIEERFSDLERYVRVR